MQDKCCLKFKPYLAKVQIRDKLDKCFKKWKPQTKAMINLSLHIFCFVFVLFCFFVFLFCVCRIPTSLLGLFEFPFFVPLQGQIYGWWIGWLVSLLLREKQKIKISSIKFASTKKFFFKTVSLEMVKFNWGMCCFHFSLATISLGQCSLRGTKKPFSSFQLPIYILSWKYNRWLLATY